MSAYADRWITCTDTELRVRAYYFPWGTKHIAYAHIRGLRSVPLSGLRGRGRIWGTANPRYWASLDPKRPAKKTALILDLGRFVHPFLTPDDPAAVQAAISAHTTLAPGTDTRPGPIV